MTPDPKKTTALVPLNNSLGGLVADLLGDSFFGQFSTAELSSNLTMYFNLRYYMISNDRQLLSRLYVEHGIVQTLIDQPVDDGFRGGVEFKTGELDADDIKKLKNWMAQSGAEEAIIDANKWKRLFGGGGIMVLTKQDPETPLDITKLRDFSTIEFRDCDLWELYPTTQPLQGDVKLDRAAEYYNYYGHKVHRSRVYPLYGKKAPSILRGQLRGWGMSEVERLTRSLSQYLKNQDVVFELLDEAKIDVYKIGGFNDAIMTDGGTATISKRIQHANRLKNYNNAITMDKDDEYDQKQMAFTGLGDMLVQIKQGVASDVKMPITKLFGVSAAGFSSGEDDIENYNSMVERDVRARNKFVVADIAKIGCQILFGFIPDDLEVEFPPLRILNAEEEEQVKNHQFNRVMSSYQSGLIKDTVAKEAINKDNLLPIELDINTPAGSPIDGDFVVGGGANVTNEKPKVLSNRPQRAIRNSRKLLGMFGKK